MKKLILLAFFGSLASVCFAQLRTTYRPSQVQGTYWDFPGNFFPSATATTPPSSISDTLQVSDTVAYILPVNHLNDVDFYQQFYWSKSGSGTATLVVAFLQSNDPYNFVAVPKGGAGSAYTKSYTLSASGWNYISFKADTASFTGRYLKITYTTSNTASVGGKVFTRIKSTIK